MSAIDEIKDRIDIVDLVGETVKLRRTGKNYTGFCPFHENTKTPAFAVFPDSGTWRCFGQCNEGGDIFRYVMKKEGMDFPQALQYLAQKAGIELEPQTPEKKEHEELKDRLKTLLEESVIFYQHHLLNTSAGKPALEYLMKRGVTQKSIEDFGLGYAPGQWDAAFNYFTKKGYTRQELLDTGMLSENQESERVFDRFRNRLMFPIRDSMGGMVGYGARALAADDVPKYLNSPQTVLFDKSRLLYGLDMARKSIRAEDQVVIVEGYMDVIGLYQAGYQNAVSPMGTALNEHQFRTLKRFTRNIILALDPDAAGEKATLRGLELARQSLDRTAEITPDAGGIFDSHGLIRSEGRLQADIRVTTLPADKDPDEIVLEDAQVWKTIIENAKPIVQHVMDTLLASQNVSDPKAKGAIIDQMVPLIKDLAGEVERSYYAQQLARGLGVDEKIIAWRISPQREKTSRTRRSITRREGVETSVIEPDSKAWWRDRERHCLSYLYRDPELLNLLNRALQGAGLGAVSSQDFDQADHQILFKLMQQSLEQDELEPLQYIDQSLPDDLRELGDQLSGNNEALFQDKLLDDLIRTMAMLRARRISEELLQMRYLQEDISNQGDIVLGQSYRKMIMEYTRTRAKLDSILNGAIKLV